MNSYCRVTEGERQMSDNGRQLSEIPTFKNLSPPLTHDFEG